MIKKMDNQELKNSFNFVILIKGTLFAWGVTLILLFIYSCVLAYTNVSDNTIPVVIIIITAISILIGSSLSSHSLKKSGLLNGGIVRWNLCVYYIFNIKLFAEVLDSLFRFIQ